METARRVLNGWPSVLMTSHCLRQSAVPSHQTFKRTLLSQNFLTVNYLCYNIIQQHVYVYHTKDMHTVTTCPKVTCFGNM